MMNVIRNSSKLVIWVLVLMVSLSACKSKKKAAEAAKAAAERARIEQEAAAHKQQQEEEARRKEAEEKAKRDAEANQRTPYMKLGQYFDAIANASSLNAANSSINEALALFASQETPVLIVISESGGQKDYDRPTTIGAYLNYLKDQKKNINKIEKLQFDNSGRITEVELRKNN